MQFKNEAKAVKRECLPGRSGNYGYDEPSRYLFQWSRLFQRVISQAGTYLLTKNFHDRQCAIYKTEGGCYIGGHGDLVLSGRFCYFDRPYGSKKRELSSLSQLITDIVLNWDPNDPVDSMLKKAAEHIGAPVHALKEAIEKSEGPAVFGGNALADFFDWNPFSTAPVDRKYERWCLKKFNGKTDKEIDQKYKDIDLGKKLLQKINKKIRESQPDGFRMALCCTPRRFEENELNFWINTGRSTQIDGWKSLEQIEEFLKSDGKLKDTAKY